MATVDFNDIPEPASPIDEMLLEFAKELKPEERPTFGPDFYNKLFDIHRDRTYRRQPRLKLVMNSKIKPSTQLKLVFNKSKKNSNIIKNSGG